MKSLFIVILTITFALCFAQKPKIEWADIPAGTFTMGSPANEVDRRDDERLHQVKLGAFKMSKTEITVAQFEAFIDATSYVTDADKGPYYSGSSIIIVDDWPDCEQNRAAGCESATRRLRLTIFRNPAGKDAKHPSVSCRSHYQIPTFDAYVNTRDTSV